MCWKNQLTLTKIKFKENARSGENFEPVWSRVRFNKIGHGSVKMNLTLTDPDDGKTITITAATLMRNWFGVVKAGRSQ